MKTKHTATILTLLLLMICTSCLTEAPLAPPELSAIGSDAPESVPLADIDFAWEAPTTLENGSPISAADIAGYTLYSSPKGKNQYSIVKVINGGNKLSYTLNSARNESLDYFIDAFDASGIRSSKVQFSE